MKQKIKQHQAFTLAEVLITLGIIGVVAALTLSPLIQKHNEKETVSKLKKVYSALSQTFLMIQNEKGDPRYWLDSVKSEVNEETGETVTTVDPTEIGDLFGKYMKVAKNCKNEIGCFSDKGIYSINGRPYSANPYSRIDMSKFILHDGTNVAVKISDFNCSEERGTNKYLSNVCGWIVIDTNGYKLPNTYGRDIFEFIISKYGIYPYGTKEETRFSFDTYCMDRARQSNGCTAWVLYNENMDYLHCDDLSWDGKHKCK